MRIRFGKIQFTFGGMHYKQARKSSVDWKRDEITKMGENVKNKSKNEERTKKEGEAVRAGVRPPMCFVPSQHPLAEWGRARWGMGSKGNNKIFY